MWEMRSRAGGEAFYSDERDGGRERRSARLGKAGEARAPRIHKVGRCRRRREGPSPPFSWLASSPLARHLAGLGITLFQIACRAVGRERPGPWTASALSDGAVAGQGRGASSAGQSPTHIASKARERGRGKGELGIC